MNMCRERCRADVLLIRGETVQGKNFFANKGQCAFHPSLTASWSGGDDHPSGRHIGGAATKEKERLEEPCPLIEWGDLQHPYQREDSSHDR